MAAWQPGFETCAQDATGTKEQPNLDAVIRDQECAELIILDGVQLFFWDVPFERLDEFVMTHQLYFTTIPEVARVICKDTARLIPFWYVWKPHKDALVVQCVDDL